MVTLVAFYIQAESHYTDGIKLNDWTDEQRFKLFAKAIECGIRDINTWRICQPVRLPGGWNSKTQRKQLILF